MFVVSSMGGDEHAPALAHVRNSRLAMDDLPTWTGIVVVATGLPLERAMSVRILDQDGRVIYPDPNFLPSDDYLQDNGMASYVHPGDTAERAGRRPLTVRAIDVASSGNEDVVVDSETAIRIRAADRRGHFISRWKVCFVVDEGR
jgi:hypothetical protein